MGHTLKKTLKVAQKLPQNPKVAQKLLSIFLVRNRLTTY